ncbi:hypothetical protein [Glaciimonas immobilis]|uniref:C-type lysozyme inhibitor domain-containing protein n=1 Tax=Glaciimonas immobilis TaxID=728004 RepID=A0A840RST9_9BURK|nr:hypothetical protein [Glaciimonas immobilis]KAF3997829.1 hypothetical protein HAV38_09530 [Glaciimonas immobilis]MBB5199539.1 hypothetical protein [Glaciimonas immobilis]
MNRLIIAIKASQRRFSPIKAAAALAMAALLAACGSPVPVTETRAPAAEVPVLRALIAPPTLVTGAFDCELGNRVEIQSDAKSGTNLIWKGSRYAMTAVRTSTGAVRYENPSSGMLWIQIPAKSMLLNTRQGAQLANECRVR